MNTFDALIATWTSGFVGRSNELEKLRQFSGRLFVLTGPPGIGKTALIARLAQESGCARHFLLNSDSSTLRPNSRIP